MAEDQIEISRNEARQGVTGRGVRYVLVGGLVLAGVVFVILMMFYR